MAVSVETAATYSAFTTDYILPGVHDQIFTGTPLLKELGNQIRAFKGREFKARVQIGKMTNVWYNPATDVDRDVSFTTPEIGAEVAYGLKYSEMGIRIPAYHADTQGSEDTIRLLVEYTDNARDSLRADLDTQLLGVSGTGPGGAHAATAFDSIWDIANDHDAEYGKAAIGGITADGTTYGYWRAHIMEGTGTYAVAVSPSLQNIERMIRRIEATVGKKPDLVLVDEAFYYVLQAQLVPQQVQQAASKRFVDWGYDSFAIAGVPVIWDPNMPGLSYSGTTDRYTAGGSEAIFINWSQMFGIKNDKWNFAFMPDGWKILTAKQLGYYNILHCWMNMACTSRRAQGHMFNVDLSQDPADFVAGTITLPVAS